MHTQKIQQPVINPAPVNGNESQDSVQCSPEGYKYLHGICQNNKRRISMVLIFPFCLCLAILLTSTTSALSKGVRHLIAPDSAADCYACHKLATPRIAQNWQESKHGVFLLKCFVCHGEPGNKGSIPFTVSPDPAMCSKCHDPAMKRMQKKFGVKARKCYSCHPFHQNSLHHDAYSKSSTKK